MLPSLGKPLTGASSPPGPLTAIASAWIANQGDFMKVRLTGGLPWWLKWQRISLRCRRPEFHPWVEKIPWRRETLPIPVFWPEEFHGLYSSWGRKKADTTERLSLHLTLLKLKTYTGHFQKE